MELLSVGHMVDLIQTRLTPVLKLLIADVTASGRALSFAIQDAAKEAEPFGVQLSLDNEVVWDGVHPALGTTIDEVRWGARLVQDLMIEELWRAWPGCREHSQPMEICAGEMLWRCDNFPAHSVPIGKLATCGFSWVIP